MSKPVILIIDDEPNIRKLVGEILEDEGYQVFVAEDGPLGLKLMEQNTVSLVLLDVWLPGMGGIEILDMIRSLYSMIPVIMISGHASVDIAVKAVKMGAFDFLEKPLGTEKIITQVRNALEIFQLKQENNKLKRRLKIGDDFIGSSPVMLEVHRLIQQAAGSDAPVFIQGENGTGKELVAHEIHKLSKRVNKSFVAVNCAAIPETLIESELFGHEKGAFTGAAIQKRGRFELAHEGTLFLDEIIDLSSAAQAKVLRALQEQQFERVGGLSTIKINVRIIAASNKDAHEAMKDKLFREDLFYRLHVLPIYVPPLRERSEDIPALVEYFMNDADTGLEEMPHILPEGMKVLMSHNWPGNVRQLRNIVQRILVLSTDTEIGRDTVEYALAADIPAIHKETAAMSDNPALESFTNLQFSEARDEFERVFIFQKLKENEYNVSRTAQVLGMYPSNLHAKIKKFNIQLER